MALSSEVSSPHTKPPSPVTRVIETIAGPVRVVSFSKRLSENPSSLGVFASKVDESVARTDRMGCDRDRFNQPERIIFEQGLVAERAGIALIGVDDDDWIAARISHGGPFAPCAKPAPPRPRRPDFATRSMSACGSIRRAAASAPPPPRAW